MLWSGLISFIHVLGEIANGLIAAAGGAVTKSGTGTWDLGRGDSGTWGRGDSGTWGRGDSGTWGRGDTFSKYRISEMGQHRQES